MRANNMKLKIISQVGFIILMAHFNGLLQYTVPMLQSFPKDSWVSLNKLQVRINKPNDIVIRF